MPHSIPLRTQYDLHRISINMCKLTEAMGNHSQGEPDSALQNHQPQTKGEHSC